MIRKSYLLKASLKGVQWHRLIISLQYIKNFNFSGLRFVVHAKYISPITGLVKIGFTFGYAQICFGLTCRRRFREGRIGS